MDLNLSKKLAWLLRHGAETVDLHYAFGGYLYVDQVLCLRQFETYTIADIVRIVESNDRFELSEEKETGKLRIRAHQGHTVKVDGLDITPITDPALYPNVIHGTYLCHLENILQHGLKRMARNHIHFSPAEPGEEDVVSTMRMDAEVFIYIDLEKALINGFKFYVSKNRVILTEGDQSGCLPAAYFKKVILLFPHRRLEIQPPFSYPTIANEIGDN